MRVRTIVIGVIGVVIGLPLLLLATVLIAVAAVNHTNGRMVSAGHTRTWLLHVPDGVGRGAPVPLVISLHGALTWPAFQANISRWDAAADAHGFIVVYPSGAGIGPKAWFMEGSRTPRSMPDVRFISDLIDTLEASYRIDPARIYVAGFSNGGGMAFVLSCTLPGRIAAVGTVAAAQSLPFAWCPDSTPVPMITFHGTADPLVPYGGGRKWVAPRPFPAVTDWAASWARRNRCGATPVDTAIGASVSRRTWTGCRDDAAVVLYTIRGGGHQWPGGKPLPAWLAGAASDAVNATREMWTFFEAHPRTLPR